MVGLTIYSRYLTSIEPVKKIPTQEIKTQAKPTTDITFDAFTVKIPSQNDFTLCVKAEKAKIYKQDQTISLTNLNCISKKNDIFLGSIKAKSAIVKQQHSSVIFHNVTTELNLSSDILQKP